MLRHVVLFRFRDDATDSQKQVLRDALADLAPRVAGLRHYHFGDDAGLVKGNYDLAVVADFESTDAYLAYRSLPAHRALIEGALKPILASHAMVQLDVPE